MNVEDAIAHPYRATHYVTHLFLAALVFVFGGLSGLGQDNGAGEGWVTVRPEGEEFAISLPKDWTSEIGEQNYHKMVLITRLYMSAAKAGPVLAVVSMSGIKSNPALYSEFQRLNSYVDAFKTWFPQKVRGKDAIVKLTLAGEKTLNGNSGREYRLTIGDLAGTAEVYATRKRFYALVVLNTKKDEELQERFVSSFRIPEKVIEAPQTVVQQPPSEPPTAASAASAAPQAAKPASDGQKTDAPPEAGSSETKPGEAADTSNTPGQKRPISGGVLNGKALYLPKPDYPPEARSARASGTVVVQVTIDEQGGVISAQAVSGHPLLQAASVAAARQARFSPTTLMGEPVKVTGVITYNFVQQ